MDKLITLSNYTFSFKTYKDKDNVKRVLIECKDTTQPNAVPQVMSNEKIVNDVLPYKAEFNAWYSMEDMPEDAYNALFEAHQLRSLRDWLQVNYSQLQMMEVVNNAEENN